MQAALQDGPVAVAFAVYNDFFNYVSGVYKADESSGLAGPRSETGWLRRAENYQGLVHCSS